MIETEEREGIKEESKVQRQPARRSFHPVRSAKRLLVFAAALVVTGALCWFFGGLSARSAAEPPVISAVVLRQQLTQVSELASVTWNYTNMAQFQHSNDFYGVKLPFTTKSFILTYDGCIKAGIDLAKVQLDVSGTEVTVTLPEAVILSHEIDEESLEVFDEKTSIFNPFTVEDYNGFQRDQQSIMEEKALGNGLLEEAATRAAESVKLLLSAALPEDYTLTVD